MQSAAQQHQRQCQTHPLYLLWARCGRREVNFHQQTAAFGGINPHLLLFFRHKWFEIHDSSRNVKYRDLCSSVFFCAKEQLLNFQVMAECLMFILIARDDFYAALCFQDRLFLCFKSVHQEFFSTFLLKVKWAHANLYLCSHSVKKKLTTCTFWQHFAPQTFNSYGQTQNKQDTKSVSLVSEIRISPGEICLWSTSGKTTCVSLNVSLSIDWLIS